MDSNPPGARGPAAADPEAEVRAWAQALAQRLGAGLPLRPVPEGPDRVVRELLLHQVELQVQNLDLRQTQGALEASRARYFELFNLAPVAYLILDAHGAVREANRAAAALLARPVWLLLRQGLGRSIPKPERGTYDRHLRQLFATGERQVFELPMLGAGPEPFWARLEAASDQQRLGSEPLGLLTISDLSGVRRGEAERAALCARLAQAQRLESLGSLAGGVAHEMNNLLAAILALATLHQHSDTAAGELQQDLEIIARACLNGRTLVLGLLGFARQGLAEERPLELNGIVADALSFLERSALARSGPDLALAEGLPPVWGDPAALTHAVMNLCLNALDAMPDGGRLTLRTSAQDGAVLLEVGDTGTGMAPEVLAQALQPFFTTKPPGRGTGLGLAMALGAAKAHGGDLELDSAPGRGTTVRLRLPAHHGPAPAVPGPAPARAGKGAGRPLRVLLVDDSLLIQRSVSPLLKLLGHAPTVAGTGEEAITLLEAALPVDAVILDLNLPGLGGAETLARLRALRPELPVLLATGKPDRSALDLAQAHDRVALLAKPFTFEELRDRLNLLDGMAG